MKVTIRNMIKLLIPTVLCFISIGVIAIPAKAQTSVKAGTSLVPVPVYWNNSVINPFNFNFTQYNLVTLWEWNGNTWIEVTASNSSNDWWNSYHTWQLKCPPCYSPTDTCYVTAPSSAIGHYFVAVGTDLYLDPTYGNVIFYFTVVL